jgi:hypothetical protein
VKVHLRSHRHRLARPYTHNTYRLCLPLESFPLLSSPLPVLTMEKETDLASRSYSSNKQIKMHLGVNTKGGGKKCSGITKKQ